MVGFLTETSVSVRVNLQMITYLVRAVGELLHLKPCCNLDGMGQVHIGFDYLEASDPS